MKDCVIDQAGVALDTVWDMLPGFRTASDSKCSEGDMMVAVFENLED